MATDAARGAPTTRGVRLHADGLRVEEVPIPRPGPHDVLVAVQAAGVGGLEAALATGAAGSPDLPLVIGREAAGVVADTGGAVDDWRIGDRVAVLPDRVCGVCPMCTGGRENLCVSRGLAGIDVDGVLSGFVAVDADRLVPVPHGIGFPVACLVPDAVGAPYHALKRAGVGDGSTVVVVGVGAVGLHAVQLATLAGAEVVAVDPDPQALQRAGVWGAHLVDATATDPVRSVRELTEGGADRVLDAAGDPSALTTAVGCVAPGGRVVLVAGGGGDLRDLDAHTLVTRELEVVGSYGATAQDVGELFDLLEEGRLDLTSSVTHTTDLDGVPEVVRRHQGEGPRAVRTVVTDLS